VIKKIPWWGWVGAIVAILLSWQSLSGWAYSRKLYGMALDNLRKDESRVIRDKDEWIKVCESAILDLKKEVDKIGREKARVQLEANQSAVEVARLKGRINELQEMLKRIVISNDPDVVINDLKRYGLRSIRRR